MGGIFGGSKGVKSESKIVDATPDQFSGLRDPISAALQSIFAGSGAPRPFSPTDAIPQPGIGAGEQEALSRLTKMNVAGSNPIATNYLNNVVQGKYLTPNSNPFLSQMISTAQRPLLEQYQNFTLPQLKQQFTASGQMIQPGGSSPFDRAAALAQNGLLNSLGDVSTNLAGQAYTNERGLQQQAAGLSQQDFANQFQQTLQTLQAQALPRLIQQNGLNQGLDQYRFLVQNLMSALGLGGSLASNNSAAVLNSGAPPASGGGASGAGSFLGGVGSLVGALWPTGI